MIRFYDDLNNPNGFVTPNKLWDKVMEARKSRGDDAFESYAQYVNKLDSKNVDAYLIELNNAREEAYKKIFANESNGLGLGMDKVVFTPVNLKTVLEVYKDLGLDFIEINNEFDAGKGSAIKIDEKAESEPQFSYLTPGELAYAILFTKILSDENSERPSVNQIKSLIGDHFEAVYCLYLDWEKRGEQLADSLEDIFNKLLNDYYDETKADDEQGDDFTQTMQNALWVEQQIKNYNDKVNNNLFQNDEYSSR